MRVILFILFFLTNTLLGQGHYIYVKDQYNNPVASHPVKIYRATTTTSVSDMLVKAYQTHYGNGSTSQYGQFANNSSDMSKMTNSSYMATSYKGGWYITPTKALNWTSTSTLRSYGASATPYDYFAVTVEGTFIPSETGTYYFGINSDDGSDLFIGGSLVTSYYGGHGMSGYRYGSKYLVKGTSYAFLARIQEYQGGEGLAVIWRKPSGGSYAVHTNDLAGTTTTSSWSYYTTLYTNSSGYIYVNYSTSGAQYYAEVSATTTPTYTSQDITDIILNATTLDGIDYWMWDLNNDSRINIADQYYWYARKNGLFSSYKIPDYKLFTSSQYTSIKNSGIDVKSSYVGYSSLNTSTLSSGSTTYYLITPGSK